MARAASPRACGVVIEEADLRAASDADVAAWLAYSALMDEESRDAPFELHRDGVRAVTGDGRVRLFLARDGDGAIAADARAFAPGAADRRHLCQVKVSVRRAHRGRGIGPALLDLAAGAADEAGRALLVGWTSSRVPAGERLARRIGASPVLEHHVNTVHRSDLDWERVRHCVAAGSRAADYRLDATDGPYSDEVLQAVARLRPLIDTVPLGGVGLRPLRPSVEDVRRSEVKAGRGERWTLCARHVSTGEIVGFTAVLITHDEPTIAQQLNTAVHPSHRGQGLCKWMKAAMLERVMRERLSVDEVRTANFGSNAAILAVNHALGFTPWAIETAWVAPVERVRARLAARRTVRGEAIVRP